MSFARLGEKHSMTNTTNSLLAIGYWQTLSKSLCATPELLPDPVNLQADERNFDRSLDKVLSYLSNGSEFVHWRGYSLCRLCGDSSKAMGSKCLTDGVWVWPEGLSHYIDLHRVDLPAEFIANMVKHRWSPPEAILSPGRDVESWYDFSFWIEWTQAETKNRRNMPKVDG